MDDPEQKLKFQLASANELFKNGEYAQCKK